MSHHGIPNNVELFLLFVKLIYIDFFEKKVLTYLYPNASDIDIDPDTHVLIIWYRSDVNILGNVSCDSLCIYRTHELIKFIKKFIHVISILLHLCINF
jgi:hypothetical protein